MSTIVCLQLDQAFMTPWHFLGNWLRKDEATTLFESAHEMSFWEYTSKNTKFGHLFNEAMADDSELMLKLVIEDVKPVFEGLTSLVDVGGGTGEVCKILNQVFPHLKCSVLELSHVVANLPNAQNLKFIEGDMFQAIPPANAVLLKVR
uniref:O-methyltransferase C-terminal domain-containing protein n=1 Tax=Cannabis sativa TaxID=3483 RepID=A0A803Q3E5_CANSA